MAEAQHDTRTNSWIDGIVGGLIGSVLMGMVAMILFPIFGIGSFWQPMNLIAAVFNQSWGTDPGLGVDSIIGLIVHMMMAAILGLMFARGYAPELQVLPWSAGPSCGVSSSG